jgi:hypothetical protein
LLERAANAVKVFTPTLRVVWIAIVAVTIVSEVLLLPTNPPLPPIPHYSYKIFKVLLFIAVGYLAPLAFWRFNALNRGIMLAAASAMGVETLQGLIGRGHSFHWYELLLKLGLILLGFALALDARHERQISAGPFHISLVGKHLES